MRGRLFSHQKNGRSFFIAGRIYLVKQLFLNACRKRLSKKEEEPHASNSKVIANGTAHADHLYRFSNTR